MSAAVLSLLALLVVIGFSLTARINVGVLAVALAWPIAIFVADWKASALMEVFPSGLFLTLLGVTLLFGIAHKNGSLDALARQAVRACGGVTAPVGLLGVTSRTARVLAVTCGATASHVGTNAREAATGASTGTAPTDCNAIS